MSKSGLGGGVQQQTQINVINSLKRLHCGLYFKTIAAIKMSSLLAIWPSVLLSELEIQSYSKLTSSWHPLTADKGGKVGFRGMHKREILNPKNSKCDWQFLHSSCFPFFLIAHLLHCYVSSLTLSSDTSLHNRKFSPRRLEKQRVYSHSLGHIEIYMYVRKMKLEQTKCLTMYNTHVLTNESFGGFCKSHF